MFLARIIAILIERIKRAEKDGILRIVKGLQEAEFSSGVRPADNGEFSFTHARRSPTVFAGFTVEFGST